MTIKNIIITYPVYDNDNTIQSPGCYTLIDNSDSDGLRKHPKSANLPHDDFPILGFQRRCQWLSYTTGICHSFPYCDTYPKCIII